MGFLLKIHSSLRLEYLHSAASFSLHWQRDHHGGDGPARRPGVLVYAVSNLPVERLKEIWPASVSAKVCVCVCVCVCRCRCVFVCVCVLGGGGGGVLGVGARGGVCVGEAP